MRKGEEEASSLNISPNTNDLELVHNCVWLGYASSWNKIRAFVSFDEQSVSCLVPKLS